MSQKLILVIGATGAQGLAVIDSLLAQSADGAPSPYAVRALSRDTDSKRANELRARGVEVVKGNTSDLSSVAAALDGVYGVYVNTDSQSLGEQLETYTGIRIFELAKTVKTISQFVYSSLDYIWRDTGYNPLYQVSHFNGKARVVEFMKAQPSVVSNTELSWTAILTGPYMEMLKMYMFGPVKRSDGTFVFAAPIGDGHMPMIALADIGFFARYAFDNRELTSGQELKVASEMVGWEHVVSTFTKVTGQKAVFKRLSIEDWAETFDEATLREPFGGGPLTFRENFSSWWRLYRDDVIKKDMQWIRERNPNGYTLEKWMKETRYDGSWSEEGVLKRDVDKKGGVLNTEKVASA